MLNDLKLTLWTHDIKNMLFAVSGYITIKDYEKAKKKISEICRILPENDFSTKSIICIENLIKSKVNKINNLSIKFDYSLSNLNNIYMKTTDICSFFGNAFDNAIEACSKIKEKNKRYIKLEIKNYFKGSNKFLIINFTNSIPNNIPKNLDTSKKNKLLHGIGLKSMKDIANKYNGTLKTRFSREYFNLTFEIIN